MLKDFNESELSELEQEFELEMDDSEFEHESGLDEELDEELGDEEFGDEEFEGASDYEEDLEQEFEMADEETGDYAERFYELAQMESESASDLYREMDRIHEELEMENFFGVGKFLKNKLKKGLKLAAQNIPALKLLKSDLIKKIGMPLLASTPYGAAATAALKALGHEANEDFGADREVWDSYVDVSREAYEQLAQNLNNKSVMPQKAGAYAARALQAAAARRGGRFNPAVARRTGAGTLRGRLPAPVGGKRVLTVTDLEGVSIAYKNKRGEKRRVVIRRR